MNKDISIWGAGLSGLIAANVFQNARVYDRNPPPTDGGHHKALLRFRSSAVGDACGIDFRKVRVHKGLWDNGYVQPNILHANNYSMKVTGRLADRSIWDLEPVDRWVAPQDFYAQLLERCNGRVQWNDEVNQLSIGLGPVISTIPMPALAGILGDPGPLPAFERSSIRVRRWIVYGADVYQTVYLSDPELSCYRVSITGNLLIAEYMDNGCVDDPFFYPGQPFGISVRDCEELPAVSQEYGKIAPIDDEWRKQFMFRATHEHDIYSLGRFATWRNILLDDVLQDCSVIKRMMAGGAYERRLGVNT
jgi:hypothetical protein